MWMKIRFSNLFILLMSTATLVLNAMTCQQRHDAEELREQSRLQERAAIETSLITISERAAQVGWISHRDGMDLEETKQIVRELTQFLIKEANEREGTSR